MIYSVQRKYRYYLEETDDSYLSLVRYNCETRRYEYLYFNNNRATVLYDTPDATLSEIEARIYLWKSELGIEEPEIIESSEESDNEERIIRLIVDPETDDFVATYSGHLIYGINQWGELELDQDHIEYYHLLKDIVHYDN